MEASWKENYSQTLRQALQEWDVPSVAAGVLQNGEVLFADGFSQSGEIPAPNAETLFQIGSCTKAFTSVAAILADRGVLDLDEPVCTYLPEFRLRDEYAGRHVTARDLLCHRSGLPRHEYAWYGTDFTRQELVDHIKYLEPNQPFRTKFQYNNYGYVLAGHIVESVTGKTYEQCLDEYLFTPLEMTRTNCYVGLIEGDANHATPYDHVQDLSGMKEIPFYRTKVEDQARGIGAPFAAAGSINSCARDMLRWVQLHLDNGKCGGRQIISEAVMNELHKPSMILSAPLDMPMDETKFCCYGMGWFVELFRGHKIIQHGGNINGFSGFTSFVPDLNLGVVAYTNMNSSFLHYALGRTIVDHYLGIENGNWVARYHDFVAKNNASLPQLIEAFTGKQVAGTTLSHPIADYTGTFVRDGYGDCRIALEEGRLVMYFIGARVPLRYFHYDTFVSDAIVGELPPGIPVHFHTAEVGGAVDSLAMPLVTEAGGKLIRFVRKP